MLFCHERRDAIAYAQGKTIGSRCHLVADDGVKMPLIRGLWHEGGDIVVNTIGEVVAEQILRFDDHAEVLVMEVDGLVARVEDGEVHLNGVAVMEDWCFRVVGIGDAEGCNQPVGRLKMVGEESFDSYIADMVYLRQLIHRAANKHRLANPVLVELPEVVLGHAVVVALKR